MAHISGKLTKGLKRKTSMKYNKKGERKSRTPETILYTLSS
ncbi:hypothetical protein STRDD10_01476 [Streptococcus sp. DD10]|nr:hypothetical protein STRDD10_01476 [Streptococcus sp. DD10]